MNLRRNPTATRRRGVILLVVLAMLTLFAIAGITFVLYANAASESARISRDAESYSSSFPDMDPNTSFNFFLNQFVYGVDDANQITDSALRGHSLAETMYGSWDANSTALVTPGTALPPSDVPFDGTGRLQTYIYPAAVPAVTGQDEFNLVNYMYFQTDGFTHDPSRYGFRGSLAAPRTTQYTGGQNAPYTYADLNNMFLATIKASDGAVPNSAGTVLQPSYFRSWTGIGALNPSTNPPTNPNPNWYSNSTVALNSMKYQTLRPRPADMGPGFPPPAQTTGDVKNLVNAPGGNDSIWIDIGAPTLSTASGLRYKMLVAPLILDLDNRINLNVVGNILANGNNHASNQGWGPWEINMSKVLNTGAAPNEWQNIFSGNPLSRYGQNGVNGSTGNPLSVFTLAGSSPHVYAKGDLNGTQDPAPSTVTGLYSLPSGSTYFPTYPAGYGGGGASETNNSSGTPIHPMFFNLFNAAPGNRLLTMPSHAGLMWAGANAMPNSDLVLLCPNNFKSPATTARCINQTTLLSMDLDRGGAAPYIYDPTNPGYDITYTPGTGKYGYGDPAPGTATLQSAFPALTSRGTTPANSEFDSATWRSLLAGALSRIELDRPLAAYPASGAQPADRQQFAMDIFWRLVNVTGMAAYYTPNSAGAAFGSVTPAPNAPSTAQYATLRWLAQLSANIVDFIDTDDVMTQFQWTQANLQPNDSGYVFGTELPKLLVNEVYLEYDNARTDPGPNPKPPPAPAKAATRSYEMNVWVELLNPLPSDSLNDPNGSNQAVLQNANGPAYQIVITSPNVSLRNADNVHGDPDGATPAVAPYAAQSGAAPNYYALTAGPPAGTWSSTATGGQVLALFNSWKSTAGVQYTDVTPIGTPAPMPANPAVVPGYLVVGPKDPAFTGPPVQTTGLTNVPTTFTTTDMTYFVNNMDAKAGNPDPPTILLQRLANPNLAFDKTTNPFITVDYVDMQAVGKATTKTVVNDARQYDPNGLINPPLNQNPNLRYSYGRNQPYGAVATGAQWQQQVFPPSPPGPAQGASQPTTTFFSVNAGAVAAGNPDWLVHLDRPLISPMELLNVSGFKPHELTQQFVDATGAKFGHVAPWTDENARLYRFLEFAKVKSTAPGIVDGGRVPGKININTLDANDLEVFRALCDAQTGNTFYNASAVPSTDSYVDTIFQAMIAKRLPGDPTAVPPIPAGTSSSKDQPFWGMALGAAAGGDPMGGKRGIAQTLLNGTLTNTAPGITHPYQKNELLNKIFNNVTTRSNTFAVWLTVGFFPITNDQVQPNQLGPEINLSVGRNIRHHMFAIVDRTQVQTWRTGVLAAGANITAGATVPVPTSVTDPRTGRKWTIRVGTTLVYDPDVYNQNAAAAGPDPAQANEETVVVKNVAGVLSATFVYPHAKGASIISRGNPGPMNNYNPANDLLVIPYSVIID